MDKIDWNKPKYPDTFVFEKVGDVLEGVVTKASEVKLETRTAKFVNVATKGKVVTLWYGKVLEEELKDVKKGDYIGVKYTGEVKGSEINPYKTYDVRIIPTEEGIDTSNIPGRE